jgi:hypothetical protein
MMIVVGVAGCLTGPTPAEELDAAVAARCSASSDDYLPFATPRTWSDAVEACRDVGGELAFVRAGAERDKVKRLIDAASWLGTVDLDRDGVWHHLDGSEAAPDWGMGQPSLAPEDECVAMHVDGKDYAEACDRLHAYVCGCRP